ncbi:MAG: SixA phosphatase family protein [Gaiellaceae bacterium]
MKRLYLLRHAKSTPAADFNADHERPLAPRGVAATERLTRYLYAQGTEPNIVLCSSARRTRETLEGISAGLHGDPELVIDGGLYCASTELLLQRLRGLPSDVESAMVIGHNPGLHDLAVLLTGADAGARLSVFPTGALVTLDLDAAGWAALGEDTCTIADYVLPRELV